MGDYIGIPGARRWFDTLPDELHPDDMLFMRVTRFSPQVRRHDGDNLNYEN